MKERSEAKPQSNRLRIGLLLASLIVGVTVSHLLYAYYSALIVGMTLSLLFYNREEGYPMRVVQTHSKRVVLGILLSALIVGVMLTIGQVPLAVSQPVTIPAKMVKGAIPMDGANPVWESVPGVIVPLSGQLITTPMHPNISVKSVFVKAMTNGKEIGLAYRVAAIRPRTIRPSVPRTSGIRRRSCSQSTRLARHPSSAWVSQAAPPTSGGGTQSGRRISARIAQASGMWTTNTQAFSGTTISKSRRAA